MASKLMRSGPARFELNAVVIACAFLFSALGANAQTLTDAVRNLVSSQGKFPIQESGYWTCDMGAGRCVYWLDDDRVIFNGTNPSEFQTTSDGRRVWRKHGIFVWNLKTNVVTKHADADRGSLCVADGYVRYSRTDGGEVVTMAGQLGKEVEISRWKVGHYPKPDPQLHGWNTQLSCHRYWPQPKSPLPGRKIGLKEGDGFLYLGTSDYAGEYVSYFDESSAGEIRLPVERWSVSPITVVRSEFDDSYIFFGYYRKSATSGLSACADKPIERQIYRLSRRGKLTTIRIPADPKLRCHVTRFSVIRDGIAIETGAGHATNLDLSTLYLVRNDETRVVLRGVVNERAVSPNGCLLALGISTASDARKPPTGAMVRGHLKVVNFCARGD